MRRVLGVLLLNVLVGLTVILIVLYAYPWIKDIFRSENTAVKCSNNIDDDGNGKIDDDDPGCKDVSKMPFVVAARDLQPKILQRDDLDVDHRYIPPADSFEGRETLIGKRLCDVLPKGEYIRKSNLVGGLECVTPEAKRAMTVKVDEVSGVAGFIKAGDRVDVLVTLENRASIVLQNIPVLAVGVKLESENNKRKSSEGTGTVITLEVSPEESQRLAFASSQGKLHLAMRNSGDDGKPWVRSVDADDLMNYQKEVIECMGSKCVVKWVNN